MKRFLWGIAVLLTVVGQWAYADSIPTFHITEALMFMGPNDGSGDNVGFTFTGPGVRITGTGGMGCFDWCSGLISDTSIANTSQIYVSSFDTAILGGKTYEVGIFDLFDGSGGLNALTSGIAGSDTGSFQFNLTLPTDGSWGLHFAQTVDQNGNPAFYFTHGSFRATAPLPTPEPATVGLMLTGIVGIAGVVKRKAKFRH